MGRTIKQRYCVSPSDIRRLQSDGFGWGHDLDSGCFYAETSRPQARRRRWTRFLTGRT